MKWVSSFSYLPINYEISLAAIENRTQRVIFDNNLNGNRMRLRFSNLYSKNPLILQHVSVGVLRDGSVHNIAFISQNGNSVIELAPGEECWSDAIDYPVSAGEQIAVSIYIKETQNIESICILWSKTGPTVSLSHSGDFTNGDIFNDCPAEEVFQIVKEDLNKGMPFYGFSGLQVYTDDSVKTIAAFGDSITHMSYVTNALYKRLYAAYPGQAALINRGIGGNRLLNHATYADCVWGNGACFGPAGTARFEHDVYAEEPVDSVVVLEGINDIMHPIQFNHPDEKISADQLTEGYRHLIEIAHKYGSRIFGATITPCGSDECPADWLPQFETVRLKINERIRSGIGYDGYFDYDAAVRNENRPGYMNPDCHIGDGLHPNDKGGFLIAAQVDLNQLME